MMKSMSLILLAGLMAASAANASTALDERACNNGYSTMLLSQKECKTWLSTRASLEKSGNSSALKLLDEEMRRLMAERAEACPCSWDQALKEKMLQKNAGF